MPFPNRDGFAKFRSLGFKSGTVRLVGASMLLFTGRAQIPRGPGCNLPADSDLETNPELETRPAAASCQRCGSDDRSPRPTLFPRRKANNCKKKERTVRSSTWKQLPKLPELWPHNILLSRKVPLSSDFALPLLSLAYRSAKHACMNIPTRPFPSKLTLLQICGWQIADCAPIGPEWSGDSNIVGIAQAVVARPSNRTT